MNEPETSPDSQTQFLEGLAEERAVIDDDVFTIEGGSWVIHGVIPYGGEVPMAAFETHDDAERALDALRAELGDHSRPEYVDSYQISSDRTNGSSSIGS